MSRCYVTWNLHLLEQKIGLLQSEQHGAQAMSDTDEMLVAGLCREGTPCPRTRRDERHPHSVAMWFLVLPPGRCTSGNQPYGERTNQIGPVPNPPKPAISSSPQMTRAVQ